MNLNIPNPWFERLDRVFLAFFVLKRQMSPHADREIAWHSATFAVSLYLVLPFSAVIILLAACFSVATGLELSPLHKRFWMIGGAFVYLIVGIFLDRRFKRLVVASTDRESVDAAEDYRLRAKFRLLTIGSFVAACTVGYLFYYQGAS